jgi:hypothetical protein
MTRTNRLTGTVQQYTSGLGWVPQGQVGTTSSLVIEGTPARPCPTPDPNDPFWHYGRPACVDQAVTADVQN